MKKSGLADSPFFLPPPVNEPLTPPATPSVPKKSKITPIQKTKSKVKAVKSNRDTMTPRHHATMVSRYHDTIISIVRSAVRQLGKEAATHRFTEEEKRGIADVIYTYKNQGVRTSENEIARIAVNFIIQDYKEHGEESVLDKVLKALND